MASADDFSRVSKVLSSGRLHRKKKEASCSLPRNGAKVACESPYELAQLPPAGRATRVSFMGQPLAPVAPASWHLAPFPARVGRSFGTEKPPFRANLAR